MGLDNYWKLPADVTEPVFDPPLNIIGDLLSDHGEGSFRGQTYEEFILEITGVSLYTPVLSNQVILQIAICLENWDRKEEILDKYDMHPKECDDLVRMFRTYADAGAHLLAWW